MYNKVTFCILYTAYSLHSLLPFACLKIVNDAKYMYHKNTILRYICRPVSYTHLTLPTTPYV